MATTGKSDESSGGALQKWKNMIVLGGIEKNDTSIRETVGRGSKGK